MDRTYVAIDLKSYYASVECASLKLNPLKTNLVVADASRTEKTICLAVSPSLKAYGISGRARLFEVVERVREVNAERFRKALAMGKLPMDENGQYHFSGSSFDADALMADPSLELSYITAPPRMLLYEQISNQIFEIYTHYVSAEDIHVYSIDECFIDVTGYLKTYQKTAHQLAITMIREVLYTTGITATAGIGTNMYLAKIAMDILAKRAPADRDGVRVAEIDEKKYREQLWCYRPLTDFWRVGRGIARRLESLGCHTMGDVARLSEQNEDLLYNALGVNAELLIDHAWGWEPTEIAAIRNYQPETNSLSSGQVLAEPYDAEKARLIVREMTELLVLDLVRRRVATRQITLTVNYDRASILPLKSGKTAADTVYAVAKTGKPYSGTVGIDFYGRPCPRHAHGTGRMEQWTNGTQRIMKEMMDLYDRIIDPELLIRRVTIAAEDLISESRIPKETAVQLDLFTDYAALERQTAAEENTKMKENSLQKATLLLQGKFGKNALLKGMNLEEGATTIQRNRQIGGHRSGEE